MKRKIEVEIIAEKLVCDGIALADEKTKAAIAEGLKSIRVKKFKNRKKHANKMRVG